MLSYIILSLSTKPKQYIKKQPLPLSSIAFVREMREARAVCVAHQIADFGLNREMFYDVQNECLYVGGFCSLMVGFAFH